MNRTATTRMVVPTMFTALLASAAISHAAPRIRPSAIRADRELMITHPTVVDSAAARYPGAWSFGGLLEELVGKENAPDIAREWLGYYYWDSQPSAGQSPVSSAMPGGRCNIVARSLGSSLALPTLADPAIRSMWMRPGGAVALASLGDSLKPRIPARSEIADKIIRPWQARDGYGATSGKPWKPNLANAPFRLLAIVNRMDLAAPQLAGLESRLEAQFHLFDRDKDFTRMRELATGQDTPASNSSGLGYGGGPSSTQSSDAGEGRLVFGAVDSEGKPLAGGWTIIFEYKLSTAPGAAPGMPVQPREKEDASVTRAWAQAWHRLGDYELGDHRFNEELEKLTRRFTHRGPAAKVPPEVPTEAVDATEIARDAGFRPVLGQLRSNEAAFGADREFRQFNLDNERFVPALLPMTPAQEFLKESGDGAQVLSRFLRNIQPLILAGVHSLPEKLRDRGEVRTLLASHSSIPYGKPEFYWEPTPRLTREARRQFSLNTCNGCHAAETNCSEGMHVHPRAAGEAARLSSFLGMNGKPNRFQDPGLKTSWVQQDEMEDRAAILAALLEPKERRRLNALNETLKGRLSRGH